MSITKSYNKHNNTYYAYDTTKEFDSERNKYVQRKRCIGHFDPNTGNIVPNKKVGRPSNSPDMNKKVSMIVSLSTIEDIKTELQRKINESKSEEFNAGIIFAFDVFDKHISGKEENNAFKYK